MSDPSHLLFLDDSGTKEYAADRSYGDGNTPYFVYGGLLLSQKEAGSATLRTRLLKQRLLGTQDVEIKSNWLRMPDERRKRYLDRLGVSDAKLSEFTDELYELLTSLDCGLVACAVNKAEVQALYKTPYQPSAIAYECVLQRVQMHACTLSGTVGVTVDAMSGATPAGRQYQQNLRAHHDRLRAHGGVLQQMAFDRIATISFRDSRADERIQLADLVAYAVYRQFVNHGDEWVTATEEATAYDYLARIAKKFFADGDGAQSGYGIVRFPMRERKRWRFTE